MGRTRRCCRGKMLRARDRDQRLVAGSSSVSLAARVCMGTPLARAYHAQQLYFHEGIFHPVPHPLDPRRQRNCENVARSGKHPYLCRTTMESSQWQTPRLKQSITNVKQPPRLRSCLLLPAFISSGVLPTQPFVLGRRRCPHCCLPARVFSSLAQSCLAGATGAGYRWPGLQRQWLSSA
jgi:hypothetical protein